MRRKAMAACLLALCFGTGCDPRSPTQSVRSTELSRQGGVFSLSENHRPLGSAEALKWHGGHRAAVSITYDNPWGVDSRHELMTDAAIQRGLCMDLERVSATYEEPKFQPALERMRTELMSRGVHPPAESGGSYEVRGMCSG